MAATYEELMLKARELAAQGDEESARRVAQIAIQRRDAGGTQPAPQSSPVQMGENGLPEGMFYNPETGQITSRELLRNNIGERSATDAAIGGGMQGTGLGFGDEAIGAIGALTGAMRGQNPADAYTFNRERARAYLEEDRSQRPVTQGVAEVAGAMMLPGMAMKPGAGAAVNAMRGAATGGAIGAGYGAGSGEGLEGRIEGAANQGILGAALGGAAGAVLPKVLDRAVGQRQRKELERMARDLNMDDVEAAARRLYERVDDAGVRIRPDAAREGVERITADMVSEGLDTGNSALNLTPKSARVAQLLDEAVPADAVAEGTMGSIPFRQLEMLRRKAGIAAGSADRADRNVGMAAINSIDDFIDNLDESQLLGGNADELKEAITTARAGWAQLAKSRTIQEVIENAQGYKSGFESGLKNGFANILRNPKRRRGFSEAEIAAMREVVEGTAAGRLMSQIGRLGFANDGGASSAVGGMAGLSVPAMLAAAAGGGPMGMALSSLGTVGAARLAGAAGRRGTKKAADRLLALAASGGKMPEVAVDAANGLPGLLQMIPQTQAPLTEGVSLLNF